MRFLLFLTGEDSQVFFVYGGTRWRDLVTIFLYLAPDVLIAQALGFQPTRGAESYGGVQGWTTENPRTMRSILTSTAGICVLETRVRWCGG